MVQPIANSLIQEKVTKKFGNDIIRTEEESLHKTLVITINNEKIIEIIKFLYEDSALQFQFLTSLFGVHYPEKKGQEIEMVYLLHNMPLNTRIRIKTYLPIQKPEINTLTTVFKTANWMERETYDFFGVIFKGHPNLKRILNVDEMDYFPMRKEYPLEESTREDKDDGMFGR